MDKCKRCGNSLGLLSGLFSDYCESCEKIVAQEKKSEPARLEKEKEHLEKEKSEQQRRQFEQLNLYKANLAKNKVQLFRSRIDSGEVFFLYRSVYLAVDSVVVEEKITSEFSIKALRALGFDGWDIVGVVPRTLGIGLQNSSIGSSLGTTWGAGVGGNVVGVHVLLKKEISATHGISDKFLEEYVKEAIFEFATEAEQQTLLDILSGKTISVPELASSENTINQNIAEPEQKSDTAQICPKCGIPMPIKVSSSGEKQGQSFYVCPNYKQCKQVFPVEA